MAVCVMFRYPRVELSGNAAGGASSTCGTASSGSKVAYITNGVSTPQPFTALRVQAFAGGFTTGTGRNVQYLGQVLGLAPDQYPHIVGGLAVPGNAGDEGVGLYILFGQKLPAVGP